MPTFELQIHGTPPTDDFSETIAARLTKDFETGPPAQARPCHPGSRIEVQVWPDFDKPRAVGSLCCRASHVSHSRSLRAAQCGRQGLGRPEQPIGRRTWSALPRVRRECQ